MMDEKAAYVASLWGDEYHLLPHNEALGAGAAGPGKTLCLLMDPLAQILTEHQRCLEDSNVRDEHRMSWGDSVGWALHLRRTLKQLMQSIAKTHRIFPKIDPGAKWDGTYTTWTFSSGYRYQFGHCKDPNSWEDYFSNDYTHLGFDELVQFEKEQYDQLCTRVRASDPVLRHMLKVRAMSNPLMQMDAKDAFTVTDPFWVRTRFVDKWREGRKTLWRKIAMPDGSSAKISRIYLPATIDDNPDKEFARGYRITLMSAPKHIQEALLKGNWYYVPGAFFGAEWDPNVHVESPFQIPDDWPIFRSMDWGYRKPGTVGWGTLDRDDNLIVIKEVTFQDKLADEVAQLVKEVEEDRGWWDRKKNQSLLVGPADPQIWEERGDGGNTKAATFAKKGVHWFPADRSRRRGSSARLLERLRASRLAERKPGITFFRNCKRCIETIPAIPADKDDPEQPMDGGEDHWCDMTRYMCSYAERGRAGVAKMKRPKEEWEEERAPARERAGYGYGS